MADRKEKLVVVTTPRFLKYAAISILAVTALVFIFLLRAWLSPLVSNDVPLPSDASLIEVFGQNEAEFNRLISMSNIDVKVVRIAPDFTWLDDNPKWPRPESELGLSKERWDEYRELFKRLGLKKGLARYPDGNTIEFIASTQGLLTGGSGKGYIYSIKDLSPLYNSLDSPFPTPGGKYVYKKLKEHWYLFYYAK